MWFNGADEIVDSIRGLRYEDDALDPWSTGGSHRSLGTDLLSDAGLELLRQERWLDLARLVDAFDVTGAGDALARFWLHVHAYRNRYKVGGISPEPRNSSTGCWRLTATIWVQENCWPWQRHCFSRLGMSSKPEGLLNGLPESEGQMRLSMADETLRPFESLLWRTRLGYLMGDRRSPADIIPESDDPNDQGMILLQRAVCTVGHIWARAWLGQNYDASSIKLIAQPILRLHCRPSTGDVLLESRACL